MNKKDIKDILDEGLEEEGTIEKAFDYLLENSLRELFEMNNWDEPKFTSLTIDYNDKKYQIDIRENGCVESTHSHRIMDWKYTFREI